MPKGTVRPDGRRVQFRRSQLGMTQEELSGKSGYAKRTIERIEAGEPAFMGTLQNIADALGVPADELVLPDLLAPHGQIPVMPTIPDSRRVPARPPYFVGREESLLDVKARLRVPPQGCASGRIQVLTAMRGWPGVGKTAFAAWLANDDDLRYAFPDGGPLWASLGKDPDLFGELAGWGRALGVDDILTEKTLDRASRRLAPLLAERRIFLVIDDVWELEHAKPFLIGGHRTATLVTTRSTSIAGDLAPGAVYRLEGLSPQASLELLTCLCPAVVSQYARECKDLARELEGLPLALHVAGRLLHDRANRGENVRNLLHDVRSGAALLDRKAPHDLADLISQTTPTVAALLQKSVDALDETSRERFAKLGVAPEKPATFSLGFLRAHWDTESPEVTVNRLIDRGLLEPAQKGRFQMHGLLVTYARSLLTA